MSNRFTVFYPMPQEGVVDYFIENGLGLSARIEGPRSPEKERFIADLLSPHKYHDELVRLLDEVLDLLSQNKTQVELYDAEWDAHALLAQIGGPDDEDQDK